MLTFVVLSMMRPLYTSEARILIQSEEVDIHPAGRRRVRNPQQVMLDEQAVQSQVQVLTSRDLAVEVINALDLTNNPEFAKDAGTNPVARLLNRMGLAKKSAKSQEENAVNTFAEYLSVSPLAKSSVIALDYTSGDSGLAATVANNSPMSTSTGSARRSSRRPRMPLPGSAPRSTCCAREWPRLKLSPSSST